MKNKKSGVVLEYSAKVYYTKVDHPEHGQALVLEQTFLNKSSEPVAFRMGETYVASLESKLPVKWARHSGMPLESDKVVRLEPGKNHLESSYFYDTFNEFPIFLEVRRRGVVQAAVLQDQQAITLVICHKAGDGNLCSAPQNLIYQVLADPK